jgi:hypothetical protein
MNTNHDTIIYIVLSILVGLLSWILIEIHELSVNQAAISSELNNLEVKTERLIDLTAERLIDLTVKKQINPTKD